MPLIVLWFKSSTLEPLNDHVHLELTLQSNCKWDKHIDNIVLLLSFVKIPPKSKILRNNVKILHNTITRFC